MLIVGWTFFQEVFIRLMLLEVSGNGAIYLSLSALRRQLKFWYSVSQWENFTLLKIRTQSYQWYLSSCRLDNNPSSVHRDLEFPVQVPMASGSQAWDRQFS